MKELKLKMKMFPYLCNLPLGNQIILFDITNDTTSAVGLALIPVGSCTWRCYTRSVTEQSLSLGPIARKFWFPADIHLSIEYQIEKSYLKIVFHDTTRIHGTHGLQRG